MKDKLKILSVLLLVILFSLATGGVHMNELDLLGVRIIPILLTCTALFFMKREIINLWWYFSLIFWFFFFILVSTDSGGGAIGGAEMAVFFLAWSYLFLSLILIAVKSWKLRAKEQNEKTIEQGNK